MKIYKTGTYPFMGFTLSESDAANLEFCDKHNSQYFSAHGFKFAASEAHYLINFGATDYVVKGIDEDGSEARYEPVEITDKTFDGLLASVVDTIRSLPDYTQFIVVFIDGDELVATAEYRK